MVKYCSKCGEKLKDGVDSCDVCGSSINSEKVDFENFLNVIEFKALIIGLLISLVFVGISGFNVYLALFGVFAGSAIAGFLSDLSIIYSLVYGALIGIISSLFYWFGGFVFGYFLIISIIGAFIGNTVKKQNIID
ncbi:hypothetical protein SAMN05216439_1304 [Methanobrevibacter gottschalkii]|uniref:Zinc-ribbon domain-containing protein n=1 Tax=Methanobrevibacter gottschalkii TaxID=190974 RepID=A0A1H7J0T9_9EURY|nr:zinc ribbon domain-containing protein [Methanobrevibacter gottschalkii]SEK67812.1 hypothetical protein SAMN05216439_1304 [Methanobrevibacter gottschalkii]